MAVGLSFTIQGSGDQVDSYHHHH
ncbi:hypothetical protein NC652_018581 [Populus alba x Populus x berolinensis]|nr:hypothetical protein NC652_018581 [Populus alba x Populus x berolinensis]